MTIEVRPVLGFEDEEPREEVTVKCRLRYAAPDDEVWEQYVEFKQMVPAGLAWQERITWYPGSGHWSIDLLDMQDALAGRWNWQVPDTVLWPLKKKRSKEQI